MHKSKIRQWGRMNIPSERCSNFKGHVGISMLRGEKVEEKTEEQILNEVLKQSTLHDLPVLLYNVHVILIKKY